MRVEKKNNDLPWKTCPRPLGAILFYCFSLFVAAPPALSGFPLLTTISQPPLSSAVLRVPGATDVRGELSPAASVTSRSQSHLSWLVLDSHRVRLEVTVGHMLQPHCSRGRVTPEHIAMCNSFCLYFKEGRSTVLSTHHRNGTPSVCCGFSVVPSELPSFFPFLPPSADLPVPRSL